MAKKTYNKSALQVTQKDKNRATLISFLSDPENEWPRRQEYSTEVLGYKNQTQLYKCFSIDELAEIEAEAMENRKKWSARQRSVLYGVLYREGVLGNITAIKDYLDRTEGKVPDKLQMSGKVDSNLKIEFVGCGKQQFLKNTDNKGSE